MRFWVSWRQPYLDLLDQEKEYQPQNNPPLEGILGWWISGYRSSDDAATICALVEGPSESVVWDLITDEWPEAPLKPDDWRFFNVVTDDWTPGDRFPLADWMKDRVYPMADKIKLILARNERIARMVAKDLGIPREQFHYLYDVEKLNGLHGSDVIVYLGPGWRQHPASKEIVDYIRENGLSSFQHGR